MTDDTPTIPSMRSSTSMVGDDVVADDGEAVGEIESLMIDTTNGRIDHVVLRSGGFLGLGKMLFAVPWNAVRLDAEHDRFVLQISREHLAEASSLTDSDWPDFASRQVRQVHHRHLTQTRLPPLDPVSRLRKTDRRAPRSVQFPGPHP